jgi:hypothetical protein
LLFKGPVGEIVRPSRPQAGEGSRSSTRAPKVRVVRRGSTTAPTMLIGCRAQGQKGASSCDLTFHLYHRAPNLSIIQQLGTNIELVEI